MPTPTRKVVDRGRELARLSGGRAPVTARAPINMTGRVTADSCRTPKYGQPTTTAAPAVTNCATRRSAGCGEPPYEGRPETHNHAEERERAVDVVKDPIVTRVEHALTSNLRVDRQKNDRGDKSDAANKDPSGLLLTPFLEEACTALVLDQPSNCCEISCDRLEHRTIVGTARDRPIVSVQRFGQPARCPCPDSSHGRRGVAATARAHAPPAT